MAMVVALSLLLLFVFSKLTGAAELPLVVRQPLVPSQRALVKPNIPVANDVHRVDVVLRDAHSRMKVARGIADIENLVYTRV